MNENNLKPWELSSEKIAQLLNELDINNDMKCGECRQALIKIGQKHLMTYLKDVLMYITSYDDGFEDDGTTPCHYYSFDAHQEEWDAILNDLGIE
ncbi:MAG: hypothetical protein WC389_15325 [Lutibacter sp.]|jgi:hypothetical protein